MVGLGMALALLTCPVGLWSQEAPVTIGRQLEQLAEHRPDAMGMLGGDHAIVVIAGDDSVPWMLRSS